MIKRREGSVRLAALMVAAAIAAAVAGLALSRLVADFAGRSRQPPSEASSSPSGFAFVFYASPRPLPQFAFADGAGKSLTIADFRGRPVLLNLWATWCVPCRKEMPALDRLQGAIGKSALLVLPLSIDQQGAPAVEAFYRELGLKELGIYTDRSGEVASRLGAPGLPVTLLINRQGHEIGRKLGPAEWDSPHVIALLREHFRLSAAGTRAGS
jgi:thiol-disulfide isomerase/thioredoxin